MHSTLICIGKFHHFHLARQLILFNKLEYVYTGYPLFKLHNEPGIPSSLIRSFPWLQAPYMAFMAKASPQLKESRFKKELQWLAHLTLDKYVASKISEPTHLISLSGTLLHSGRANKSLGGINYCDRGSSHISYQNSILEEEYLRYNSKFSGIDPRSIDKELLEYEEADYITIPSQFCYDSFLQKGVPADKLVKIPYGSNTMRFFPSDKSLTTPDDFNILFVGSASPRKGFIDLLKAFQLFQHPKKKLTLIGSIDELSLSLLNQSADDNIEFLGSVPNHRLVGYYQRASVLVMPSIEEGLCMVIGEAMATGCPVIATHNTGASELINNGCEGFIVPIRRPDIISDCMTMLADDYERQTSMGLSAIERVSHLGGWDKYGSTWNSLLSEHDTN